MKYAALVVISLSAVLFNGCSAVNTKLSSYEPSVVSLGSNKFSISYYAKNLEDAGAKLDKVSNDACKGRSHEINDYQTDDYRPVYVAVKARITCK